MRKMFMDERREYQKLLQNNKLLVSKDMGLSTFILLSALIYQGSHAMECYNCVDCQGELGDVYDCSIISSTSCYLTKTLSTSQVTTSCGLESFNLTSAPNSCETGFDIIYCQCDTNLCNTLELLPTSTTTSAAVVTERNKLYCYQCMDCGMSTGVLADCSEFSETRYCYYIQETNGERRRRCGTEYLDTRDYRVGCNTVGGFTICKCTEAGCNRYPELVDSTTTTTSRTTTTTSTAASPPTAWRCYVCVDCGDSTGILEDCSQYGTSRSCLLHEDSSGKVTRGCGLQAYDEVNLPLSGGCLTRLGTTICKCSEEACNAYPEFIAPPNPATSTREATEMFTGTESTWSCYVCVNCGKSVGAIIQCTAATSCSLVVEGKMVTRSCGSAEVDAIIPQDKGCKITADGVTVCKCTTSNCNIFSELTGATVPNTSESQVDTTTWPSINPPTQASSTLKATSWLVLFTNWLQHLHYH